MAHTQASYGAWRNSLEAEAGDLIFFGKRHKLGWYAQHVGIVVSNHQGLIRFIHASRSEGITITTLNEDSYWKERFLFVKNPMTALRPNA